jgi:hypothetical protein
MGLQTWQETLTQSVTDGPTLTAAARASCIPTPNRITLPPSYFYLGKVLRFTLLGRISIAAGTPGTGRFDIALGSGGTTIVFDTAAFNLNTAAKTNVPFLFETDLVCRAIGSAGATTFFPTSTFQSESVIGSPVPTAGGNGSLLLPTSTPAVGSGTDNTTNNAVDVFFTQTVATGSLTVHNYRVEALN